MSEAAKTAAAQSATPAASAPPKKANGSASAEFAPLKRESLKFFEFTNNSYRGTAPHGVKPEDLSLHPMYWNAVSDELRSFDSVRMVAPDYAWVADYMVCEARTGYAVVKLLYSITLPPRTAQGAKSLPVGYEIRESDANELPGYVIVRTSDGHRLGSGVPFEDFEQARRHLLDHAIFKADDSPRYVPG